jgi:hypothetical protein
VKTHVEFRSNDFPPYPEEDELINPGLFGKRVAEFLVAGLRAEGFEPDEPATEDWGWYFDVRNEEFPLWIGCANYAEYPDGFLCFIEPHKRFVRGKLFRKIDTTAQVEALQRAMDKILSNHPGIRDMRWWTYEEFNHPSGD